ncbi:MAG: hypothetical protein SPI53_06105 [Erysipelotrichaceae bacterium]|nr:hypothetical protein [Erysipelotrichaceae bacterium]
MKLIRLLILLLIVFIGGINISASDEYLLVDHEDKKIGSYASYDDALSAYNQHINKYQNIAIKKGKNYLKTKYGVVQLKTVKGCTYDIKYRDNFGRDGSINGCKGIDAQYLDTASDLSTVKIKISGIKADVNFSDAIIIPYEHLKLRTSTYININGNLYHQIKTQFNSDHYTSVINLGKSPNYIDKNKSYFSYDGHYFYDDFYKMTDDYRQGNNHQAINSQEVYYNYYQYLPHRSLTGYNANQLNNYFKNNLNIDHLLNKYQDYDQDGFNDILNQSQYFNRGDDFISNQYLFGANALMLISTSMEESDYGRSLKALTDNNVYDHIAFEKDTQLQNNRFNSVADSIYNHAKYFVSGSFANNESKKYNGSFFGNKESGINTYYSNDPYWGEKVASNYYKLDTALGNNDFKRYALGILKHQELNIYQDQELKESIYKIKNINNYAVILLGEGDNFYKIQIDAPAITDYRYDFEKMVGYIKKSALKYRLDEQELIPKVYTKIEFDADGGKYHDGDDKLVYNVEKGSSAGNVIPYKKGYEFIGYDQDNEKFKAKYLKIKAIKIIKGSDSKKLKNNYPDLSGDKLMIDYEDGTNKEMAISTDMLKTFKFNQEGKGIITYNGVEVDYQLPIIDQYDQNNKEVRNLLDDYSKKPAEDKLLKLKKYINDHEVILNIEEIRFIDDLLIKYLDNRVNLHIKNSNYNLNLSGLALALDYDSFNKDNFLIKDTIDVRNKNISGNEYARLSKFAKNNGYTVVDSFKPEFYYNYDQIVLNSPMVISLTPSGIDDNAIYTVFSLDADNDIVKLKTIRSKNYLTFLTKNIGSYLIAKKNTANNYNFKDNLENINKHSMNYNEMTMFLTGGVAIISLSLAAISVIIEIKRNKNGKITKNYRR